ncbi:hypothetical protein SDRG_08942 [Saprolegnia diclina VS20]|uniref:Chromo domain-containing protein n=1 Tax=Saprolegnia diclina (strain VS20) TaxID=1156394 RepID=T0RT36_SAPDV|nr:hypothetical protein SDRG_08942 [Saprolegnia diclina VS20]EQC33427.1 hypothetical protein SDRG_08942 [Saprolegnia diclina VS20]|eukprot:XP_008613067.1 hypothetical protein SDRG_08942 [Saprolegnia diclina VS20]
MRSLDTNTFNVDHLKNAPPHQAQYDGRPLPKATPIVFDDKTGEELHVIEAFLKKRTFNRKPELLVKWQGLPEHEATWELVKDVKHVAHFQRLIKELNERRRRRMDDVDELSSQ